MDKRKFDWMSKGALACVMGVACLFNPLSAKTAAPDLSQQEFSQNWTEFHSTVGKCSMSFPDVPEHVSEKMAMPEEGYELKYDAYISALNQQTIFMLLIAQYPEFVDESYAQMSLEGFLNGILTHNPGNQLIFADLLLVNGYEALDFFIRTGNVYFKGRAMMVKNSLYLMAMECEIQSYDEINFKQFIDSFKLSEGGVADLKK